MQSKHKISTLPPKVAAFSNEVTPCVPIEHLKTLECSACLVAPGALINAGQDLCIALKSHANLNNTDTESLIHHQKSLIQKKAQPHIKIYGYHAMSDSENNYISSHQVLTTSESGQVIKIDRSQITLRRAHCYFISPKGSVSVVNKEYIKKGNGLFNIRYEKLLTGDIVQGLGKIEELLEYPRLSLNLNFKTCLRRYLTKVSLDKAIQWSYAELQTYLVQSIQQVYVDQGCFISDKHLEIIVRQATCFGIILFPGDTGFLHHEVVLIDKIEKINKQLINLPEAKLQDKKKQKAIYYPHLKGITWNSLNSNSVLSAASFQETRRVLRDNLVTDKGRFFKRNKRTHYSWRIA